MGFYDVRVGGRDLDGELEHAKNQQAWGED